MQNLKRCQIIIWVMRYQRGIFEVAEVALGCKGLVFLELAGKGLSLDAAIDDIVARRM